MACITADDRQQANGKQMAAHHLQQQGFIGGPHIPKKYKKNADKGSCMRLLPLYACPYSRCVSTASKARKA